MHIVRHRRDRRVSEDEGEVIYVRNPTTALTLV